ncbi:MAG TPA: radical SAM protein [Polyangiaceae bacterium]|nr:radical SAM protein [Polyangiaceae bacterium]
MTPETLSAALELRMDDARKIVAAVHRGWVPASGASPPVKLSGASPLEPLVRRSAANAVRARGEVPALVVAAVRRSLLDPFVKLALRTHDGHVVEAVRIPLERPGRFSVCVSSQAGCALACAFCATGRLGLARNLAPWEIIEQVREVRATLGPDERVHGVVFQGMGEPLANVDRVIEAIHVMREPSALAIDARAITVCTSGVPSAIRKLAREVPKVRLGLSIASARRAVRRALMPIDDAHPLDAVLDAVGEHARVTGLAPLWAVTPLAGVNDTEEDARALAERAAEFQRATGVRPRVSVVPYNTIEAPRSGARDPFERGDVAAFVDRLTAHGLRPKVRYSGGGDIAAACGQLAGGAEGV